jgi:hypothetical protein
MDLNINHITHSSEDEVKAWHFLYPDWKLRVGGTAPPNGAWLNHPSHQRLELCVSGLHASKDLLDAFAYAPSACLCRVVCGGGKVFASDKLVCRRRKILERHDISKDVLKAVEKHVLTRLYKFRKYKKLFPKTIGHIQKTGCIEGYIKSSRTDTRNLDAHFSKVFRILEKEGWSFSSRFSQEASDLESELYDLKYIVIMAIRSYRKGGFYTPQNVLEECEMRDLVKKVKRRFKCK